MQIGVDWNAPIRLGDAALLPRDLVLATDEATIFFPPEIADEVIARAVKHRDGETANASSSEARSTSFAMHILYAPYLKKSYEETLKKERKKRRQDACARK